MKNTMIVFGYVDRSNTKFTSKEYVFEGVLSPTEVADLVSRFELGEELLIPNQINPAILNCCPSNSNKGNSSNEYGYDDDEDHPHHRIWSIEEVTIEPNLKMSIKEFYKATKTTVYNFVEY